MDLSTECFKIWICLRRRRAACGPNDSWGETRWLEVSNDGLCIGTLGTQVSGGGFQHSDTIVTLCVDVFHAERFEIRQALLDGGGEAKSMREDSSSAMR